LQYRYLLIVRFALVNVVAAAMLLAAWMQGWLDTLLTSHLRELSFVIAAVFLYGLSLCGLRIWRSSLDLNNAAAGRPDARSPVGRYLAQVAENGPESRAPLGAALRIKLTDRVIGVRHIANALVFLGLIGTVIGFIVALSGVDPETANKVENISPMISTLINGMSVALYTTLVGAVLYVWLMLNYRILVSGTVDLIAAAFELGERRGRP
jgi:hypothetical protein